MSTTVIATGYSSNAYATNEKPVQMYSTLFRSYADLTPLTYILSKLGSDTTQNSRIDWTEQNEQPTTVRVTAAAAAAAGTLTITDHYTYLRNHDMLFNPKTFELIKVEGYTTIDASVDVVKGWGATTDSAVESGQLLQIISSAYYEGSEEAYPRSPLNTNFFSYTQEIVDSIRTSRRTQHEKTYFSGPGGKRMENQMKMNRAWRIKLEMALWLSFRADVVSTESGFTSQYIKTMSGLVEKLYNGSNYMNVGGPLTETVLEDWLTSIYEGTPDISSLLCVCAPKVYQRINQMVKPLIRISPNTKKYGMNLKNYDGAISLDLVRHPLFTGDMSGWMFVLDLSKIKLIYQEKPVMERDVAEKRNKYIEDQMYGLVSLLAAEEKRHGFADGIT